MAEITEIIPEQPSKMGLDSIEVKRQDDGVWTMAIIIGARVKEYGTIYFKPSKDANLWMVCDELVQELEGLKRHYEQMYGIDHWSLDPLRARFSSG